MSNFSQLEYCERCVQMTNHNWYDNTPKHHQYTAECQKCGLKTLDTDWDKHPAHIKPKPHIKKEDSNGTH